MRVFKIRRKSDGLYSMGGTVPHWNKVGKTWNTVGHIKSHLAMFKDHLGDYNPETRRYNRVDNTPLFYSDCEIVEYDMSIAEVLTTDVCP